jgi:chaperonin GroES
MFKVRAGFHPARLRSSAPPKEIEGQPVKKLSNSDGKGKEISMKIRPLQDRVIVKRIAEEEKTKGGIIIPDTAKEKPQEGKVVAVGKGKVNDDGKLVALDVKVGDKILFGKYSGSEIKLNGEEHLIMREDDILGVVEG